MRFKDVPKFYSYGNYKTNVDWRDLLANLERYQNEHLAPLNLNPDYQRAHVWTEEQQRAYVEYIIKGGFSGKDLFFNCPGWMADWKGSFELVDGKQRLNAVMLFLTDNLKVFEGRYYSDFTDHLPWHCQFIFHVNDLPTRKDVISWYLEMNTGGTPHTPEELERVRELLKNSH